MPPLAAARLPTAPVVAWADCSVLELGRRLGTLPKVWYRWASEGIPIHSADRIAVALGAHPATIWGEAWWLACWEQDDIEAEQERRRLASREWRRRRRLVRQYEGCERAVSWR